MPADDFSQWLRRLRTARDLTQEMLAESTGCASQTIRSYELGRRRPSREMAARLADVLAVSPSERDAFLRSARAPVAATDAAGSGDVAAKPAVVFGRQRDVPLHADALIGRHDELERLRNALLDERQRLVTLLGPGGIGKTRLALQTAADLAPHFADGAAVVALASVGDVAGLLSTTAAVVGCPLSNVAEPQAALLTFLRERSLLLVLDNLEHLLGSETGDAIVDLLTALLREAPGVQLLVTSRERLRLRAEWVVEVGGLHVPPDDQPASIVRADAVLLFVERARRLGDFALGPDNQRTVADICRRLDGLPLAIELAAAQVLLLPPAALLQRLDRALPLLEGGARDLPDRQRTMRAAIGWSYDLLPPDERRVFERLGVLVGGFSLEAAEAVGAGDAIEPAQVLGLLRRLVDRSLVVRDGTVGDDLRYRLLEPVRQYALDRLDASVDQATAARQRHADFFQALAEQLGPRLRTALDTTAFVDLFERLDRDYPNIRAAVAWALATGRVDIVAQIGWALFHVWWYRSEQDETLTWIEQAQALIAAGEQLPPLLRARALLAYAAMLYGDAVRRLALGNQALELFEQLEDAHGQGYVLMFVGLAYRQSREVAQAARALQQAYELGKQLNDAWLISQSAIVLGTTWSFAGEHVEADRWLTEGLATAEAGRDTWNIVMALFALALAAQSRNDVASAGLHFRAWLAFTPKLGINNGSAVAHGLESIAVSAVETGEPERAARLFAAVEVLWALAGRVDFLNEQSPYQAAVASARRRVATPAFETAWAEGRAMTATQAVRYAIEPVS